MDNELMKKMDMQVQSFKKFRDYIDLLDRDVAKNGFLLLEESSYKKNIREFAVKKSEFVAIFSDKENLSRWFAQTTTQNKNFLYDLAKNNNFEITDKDLNILSTKENIIPHGYHISNTTYTLNSFYTKEKADSLKCFIKDFHGAEGEKHLNIQESAAKFIENSTKNLEISAKTYDILSSKFGEQCFGVLSDFKDAVRLKEVEEVDGDFVITCKSLSMPQRLRFSVGELNKINEVTTLPPSIKSLNDKFRLQETRPEETRLGMKIS